MLLLNSLLVLQRTAEFGPGAPSGTGLEWMALAALLLPALLLIVLVYLGADETV